MGRRRKSIRLMLWMNGIPVGTWEVDSTGRHRLIYTEGWMQSDHGRVCMAVTGGWLALRWGGGLAAGEEGDTGADRAAADPGLHGVRLARVRGEGGGAAVRVGPRGRALRGRVYTVCWTVASSGVAAFAPACNLLDKCNTINAVTYFVGCRK